MTKTNVVIVLDCGATNLRSIAVDPKGRLLAEATRPNNMVSEEGRLELGIWDLDGIYKKLCSATREVLSKIPDTKVDGLIVATWGADGAPVRGDGSLTYPVISWQCSRTEEIARKAVESMSPWRVYQITGYQMMAINTLFKLIWLRENEPDALETADHWLMMPGLIASRFGAFPHIDPTSASTTMAMDLSERDWSEELLEQAGLTRDFFPDWRYPGDLVGEVSLKTSKESGLPSGTPILAGGHDTQFALLGSCARPYEAILSSGTWEILAQRLPTFNPNREGFEGGLIFEADAVQGLFDPQILMMGSGVLEWVRTTFFGDLQRGDYDLLIGLGRDVPPGSNGVTMIPSFVSDSGPTRRYGTRGTLLGLQLGTGRNDIYRATLEGLSYQLRQALDVLSTSLGVRAKGIRVVGGGAKNDLWNQIRADVTRLPITTTSHKEATVLGAAMVAFTGAGRFDSIESALAGVDMDMRTFTPGDQADVYEEYYKEYQKLPTALAPAYRVMGKD